MAIFATFFIIFVISNVYGVTVPKNATDVVSSKVSVAEGVTVSKGFQKTSCLASNFGVLCASSTVDGCVTKNSKTKCGKQCICGPTDCACGTSGCYCQVNAGCRCNVSRS